MLSRFHHLCLHNSDSSVNNIICTQCTQSIYGSWLYTVISRDSIHHFGANNNIRWIMCRYKHIISEVWCVQSKNILFRIHFDKITTSSFNKVFCSWTALKIKGFTNLVYWDIHLKLTGWLMEIWKQTFDGLRVCKNQELRFCLCPFIGLNCHNSHFVYTLFNRI